MFIHGWVHGQWCACTIEYATIKLHMSIITVTTDEIHTVVAEQADSQITCRRDTVHLDNSGTEVINV